MLGTVLHSCKNITVLNFGTIHFTSGSPFKAMCDLQSKYDKKKVQNWGNFISGQ